MGRPLASWNCTFEGARGGMYQVDKAAFKQQVQAIMAGGETVPPADTPLEGASLDLLKSLCPACRESGFAVSGATRRNRATS